MKTIAFYSYKGGAGRTLLTAHIAHYLVRFGKRVVVMDLDFDAPGVPAIFGLNAFTDCQAGGVLDLALDYLESQSQPETTPPIQPTLERLLLHPGPEAISKTQRDLLRILPSGNAGSSKYWDSLSSNSTWFDFLSNPTEDQNQAVIFFNHFLKPALRDMGTDYLLIDSRAGINQYARLSYAIADKSVVLFSSSAEAVHARAYVATKLRQAWTNRLMQNQAQAGLGMSHPAAPPSVVLVLSRIPPELKDSQEALQTCASECVQAFDGIPGSKEVLPFHSDLQTHLDQKLRFPTEKTPEQVVVFHQDVVRILARLCPEEIPPANREASLEHQADALWQRVFQRSFEITYVNRMFGLVEGIMLNVDDDTRNVAFKVDTFLRFLNNFFDGFMRCYTGRNPTAQPEEIRSKAQEFELTLTDAGHQCGEAFGKAFDEELQLRHIDLDDARIEEWCQFDSRAGFGHLIFNAPDTLQVKDIFLWKPEITRERDFTAFFTGYAENVLSRILRKTVRLEVQGRPAVTMVYKLKFN